MRKRREVDYGYDGPNWDGCQIKESEDYNGIMEFESGPSRITIDDLERLERKRSPSGDSRRSTSRSRKRRIALSLGLALPFLTLAAAAPPAYRDTTTIAPTPTPTRLYTRQTLEPEARIDEEEIDYDIQYLTSMSTPTQALPTDVYVVAETRLPFYLSQNQEGSWTKVDNAWFLYGRQAGVATANFGPDDDPIATAVPTSYQGDASQFAITDALPPGWGIEATRSEFYRTPLIVAMSVILALMIVAGIIFIVINRRKQHRRAKRRAARLRRKALAAAGLTEEDVNNNGGDSALREKLAKIEGTTAPKPRTKEKGPTSLIRTKVRSWNQGVLRRRQTQAGLGPSRSQTPSIEVIEEEKPDQDPNAHMEGGRRSDETNRSVPTDASRTSIEQGGTSASPDNITSDTNTNETSSSGFSRSATQPPTATYFPPAYRPASVRSLQLHHQSGPSSSGPAISAGSQHSTPRTPPVVEKTTAPGYYPAPATEDSEVALAVASRSDGKQRMDAPPPEDEEEESRVRHIATDDKLVLERMRLGGSAPPQRGSQDDGPSAPTVEVDDQGFEVHTDEDTEASHEPPTLAPVIGESSSSILPAPPRQRPMAFRVYSHADLAETLEVDEAHLLPSAPPPAHEDHLVPSAPPLTLPEEEDGEETPSAPTAPSFEIGDEDEDITPTAPEAEHEETADRVPSPRQTHRDHAVSEADHHRKPSLPTYEP